MNNQPITPQTTDLAHLRPLSDDEIDLGELLRKLIKEWKIVSLTTVVGAILGIAYALSATPVYQVEAIISEPTLDQLGNTTEQALIKITPGSAFLKSVDEASKPNVQRQAFIDSQLYEVIKEQSQEDYNPDTAFSQLRQNLKIEKIIFDYNEVVNDQVSPLRDVRISLETTHPVAAVDFLSLLIKQSNQTSVSQFGIDTSKIKQERIKQLNIQLDSLTSSAEESRTAQIQRLEEANELKIAKIQQNMSTLLTNAAEDRKNRIVQLEEALRTAKELQIKEPVTWDDLRPNQRESQITNELGETTKASPLYFQGTRILAAEISRLKSRQDDRPFIGDYNQLAQQIENLRNDPEIAALKNRENDTIYVDSFNNVKEQIAITENEPTDFNSVQFNQVTLEPVPPLQPFKPNKKLIVVAATVLAGFLGLFLALIRIAVIPSNNDNQASNPV